MIVFTYLGRVMAGLTAILIIVLLLIAVLFGVSVLVDILEGF